MIASPCMFEALSFVSGKARYPLPGGERLRLPIV